MSWSSSVGTPSVQRTQIVEPTFVRGEAQDYKSMTAFGHWDTDPRSDAI